MKTSVPTANRKPKNLNSNLIDGWAPGRSRDAGGAGLPIPAAAPATATPWNHDHTRNHGFRRPVLCSNFVQATRTLHHLRSLQLLIGAARQCGRTAAPPANRVVK